MKNFLVSWKVRQEDRKRLFWRVKIGGKVKEWEAEITEQVPDQRIAWESVDGSSNSGTITFEKIDADWTRVNATIGYEPEGQPYEGQRETSERTASAQPRETGRESTIEVPLSKEEVKVGKRTVGAGEVKLHETITTEQVNVPVELKREDIVVERVPAHEVESGKEPFQEEQIKIPLSREEPVVEKEIRVTGGVRVRKTEGVEKETIRETVRREDVDVDESSKASGSGKGRIDPGTGEEKL